MLTLTRKPGEVIVIETPAGQVRFWATWDRKCNQIKITFDAPREIEIWREELLGSDGKPK